MTDLSEKARQAAAMKPRPLPVDYEAIRRGLDQAHEARAADDEHFANIRKKYAGRFR